MKTATKILLLVGALLVAAGLALGGIALFSGKISTGGFSNMPYETKTYEFDAAPVEKIKVESEFMDIVFEKSQSDDKITVLTNENEEYQYTVTFEDGVLTVKYVNGRGWKRFFSFSFGSSGKIVVSVPEELYKEVKSIETASASGDTTLVSGLEIGGDVMVGCASGETEMTGCKITGNVSVGSASGDLDITGCDIGGNVSFGGASGSVDIVNTDIKGKLDVGTSSGSVDLEKVVCGNIEFESASGSVDLESVSAGDINIDTTSGGIDFEALKAGNVVLESTSGSIKGELYGQDEYIVNAKSTSGHITVPESALGATKKLNVETVSGNIRIGFAG